MLMEAEQLVLEVSPGLGHEADWEGGTGSWK